MTDDFFWFCQNKAEPSWTIVANTRWFSKSGTKSNPNLTQTQPNPKELEPVATLFCIIHFLFHFSLLTPIHRTQCFGNLNDYIIRGVYIVFNQFIFIYFFLINNENPSGFIIWTQRWRIYSGLFGYWRKIVRKYQKNLR